MDMTLLFFWVLFALVGVAAAKRRGFSEVAGLIGGLLLGPFSILMFLISSSKQKCPHCAEWIKKEATVCPRCQRDLARGTAPSAGDGTTTSSAR